MAELVNTFNIGENSFNNLKRYLDGNPEYLLLTSPSGATLKVDIKQQKDEKDSAENIVVRWCEQIIGIINSYYSKENPNADVYLNSIRQICEVIKIAAGCVE